jgi:hypothetical protein
MDRRIFLNDVAGKLSSDYPEIYMEIYESLTRDFLNLDIFNDEQKGRKLIEKYRFNSIGFTSRNN